ncbi:MAG TPA: hypothetical protein VL026_01635 [Rhizomicrobium sp.]|nr:hypothetical protein [Rhizomicrobium sp.]
MSGSPTVDPHYPAPRPYPRWRILRALGVLQLKLLIGNIHNFLLMPVCLFAGAIDILFKNRRDEALLYKTLAWAHHVEERIGLYNALYDDPANPPQTYSIDAVIARLETVIKTDFENGGTTATMKRAAEKVLTRVTAHSKHKNEND